MPLLLCSLLTSSGILEMDTFLKDFGKIQTDGTYALTSSQQAVSFSSSWFALSFRRRSLSELERSSSRSDQSADPTSPLFAVLHRSSRPSFRSERSSDPCPLDSSETGSEEREPCTSSLLSLPSVSALLFLHQMLMARSEKEPASVR